MPPDNDALTKFLNADTLRPILKGIGTRIRIDEPVDVLRAALALLHTASVEKVEKNARLLLQYPGGDCKELRFWSNTGPRLVAKDGKLVS